MAPADAMSVPTWVCFQIAMYACVPTCGIIIKFRRIGFSYCYTCYIMGNTTKILVVLFHHPVKTLMHVQFHCGVHSVENTAPSDSSYHIMYLAQRFTLLTVKSFILEIAKNSRKYHFWTLNIHQLDVLQQVLKFWLWQFCRQYVSIGNIVNE